MSERCRHPVFARVFERMASKAEAGQLGRRRAQLLAHASGRVVEVGAGTGENFKHYPEAVTSVDAVEPDPSMRRYAHPRVPASIPLQFSEARGDALPFGDAAFDTAVVTLVLCSVDDVDSVLAEVRRVLVPGGRLLLLEHVRGVGRLARWQDRLERPWGVIAGGCHPNRATLDHVERSGFVLDEVERFDFPGHLAIVRPHVQAVAHTVGVQDAGAGSGDSSSAR
ncbi:MAG: class I SAM-dependent methyltransferase [Acidimicrobiia bacterium]|nr:class I SAM-dependent methyltransferase [Acidimicrobiia bacterium]